MSKKWKQSDYSNHSTIFSFFFFLHYIFEFDVEFPITRLKSSFKWYHVKFQGFCLKAWLFFTFRAQYCGVICNKIYVNWQLWVSVMIIYCHYTTMSKLTHTKITTYDIGSNCMPTSMNANFFIWWEMAGQYFKDFFFTK